MKSIIRVLSVIAIVGALLLGGGAVLPVAATPAVTVTIDAPGEAAPNSSFTANVNIDEVTNFDACQYDVSFDASMLRLDDVTSGLIGSTEIPIDLYNEVSPGTYRLVQNVPGLAGVSGSGYLSELHFHTIGGQGSQISLSNGVLSDIAASEIEATWAGGSVGVAAEAPQANTPPPAANPSPESTALPSAVDLSSESTTPPSAANPSPEPAVPSEVASLSAEPINWPVLWKVIGGVVVVGLIILLLARRRAY